MKINERVPRTAEGEQILEALLPEDSVLREADPYLANLLELSILALDQPTRMTILREIAELRGQSSVNIDDYLTRSRTMLSRVIFEASPSVAIAVELLQNARQNQ